MTPQVVVDTNILLLHAFSLYDGGRVLDRVWPSSLAWPDSQALCRSVRDFANSYELVTTPYALLEFKHVATTRAHLDDAAFAEFLGFYAPYLSALQEEYIPITDILSYERDHAAWWLCFADTSLVLATLRTSATLFTLDWPVYNFTVKRGGSARHLVEWFYGGLQR